MYKIIALMGKAGSGKDTMMRKVLEKTTDVNEINCVNPLMHATWVT